MSGDKGTESVTPIGTQPAVLITPLTRDAPPRNPSGSGPATREDSTSRPDVAERNGCELSPCDATLVTDERGQILSYRGLPSEDFPLPDDQLLGASVFDLLSGLTPSLLEHFFQNLQNESPALIHASCKGKGGGCVDVRVLVTALRNPQRQVTGFVFFFVELAGQKAREVAERHRAMIASIGAACHHLGQPATVLTTNLELIRRLTANLNRPDVETLLNQCCEAAEKIAEILRKLNRVSEFRTVQYLDKPSRDPDRNIILDI